MNLIRPGTVSKILWHFTGGPLWSQQINTYSKERKPEQQAYDILKSICSSKVLKVGSFREKISVGGNYVETKKVCCVADIPIGSLGFHSMKYGKIAIGFKRSSLIRERFNPVFYVKEDKPAVLRFHEALNALQSFDVGAEQFMVLTLGKISEDSDIDQKTRDELIKSLDEIKDRAKDASSKLRIIQSFIKTLSVDEFDTIFCEREWRNDVSFKFQSSDVAMIVLPRSADDGSNYYSDFIQNQFDTLGLDREIPVIPWEDLIEH